MRHYLLLSLLFILSACSYSNNIESRLAGRGPLGLSDNNPYLAANLLLGEKIKDNSAVGGFIKYKGLPRAIEVKKSILPPATVIMYYPYQSEAYKIEGQGEDTIVTGPEPIDAEVLTKIDEVSRIYTGTPILVIDDVPFDPRKDSDKLSINTITPPLQEDDNELDVIKKLQSEPDLPLTEVSPKGDIVHYVTYEGETLSMVSLWYTYDVANVDRISRLNSLNRKGKLEMGDTIFIPNYLVKSKIKLTEKAVTILKKYH